MILNSPSNGEIMRRSASEIIRNLQTRIAKLEQIDEELRKRLRKENKEGFLMAEEGDIVGVHLNKNKFPFFNIKKPRRSPQHKGIYPSQTLGHVRALVLTDVWFYVGVTGIQRVTFSDKTTKEPYAGANGHLTAVELPLSEEVYGDSFNEVPRNASKQVFFNPRDRDLSTETFKMHNFFFVDKNNRPVKEANMVVMRDWSVFADGLVYMSDAEIDKVLGKFGLTQEEVVKDLSFFNRKKASINPSWVC
jgi:hypothetical protein